MDVAVRRRPESPISGAPSSASDGSVTPSGGAGARAAAGDSDSVPVVCGSLEGLMLLPSLRIILDAGTPAAREVSPTEFERLGGRGSSKKWRRTVFVLDGARACMGLHGPCMGGGCMGLAWHLMRLHRAAAAAMRRMQPAWGCSALHGASIAPHAARMGPHGAACGLCQRTPACPPNRHTQAAARWGTT